MVKLEDAEKRARAKRYLAACQELGLSLEGMARRLDISLSTSNRYRAGTSPVPKHVLELLDRWISERKGKKKRT